MPVYECAIEVRLRAWLKQLCAQTHIKPVTIPRCDERRHFVKKKRVNNWLLRVLDAPPHQQKVPVVGSGGDEEERMWGESGMRMECDERTTPICPASKALNFSADIFAMDPSLIPEGSTLLVCSLGGRVLACGCGCTRRFSRSRHSSNSVSITELSTPFVSEAVHRLLCLLLRTHVYDSSGEKLINRVCVQGNANVICEASRAVTSQLGTK